MILISKYGYILKAFLLDRHIIFNNEAREKNKKGWCIRVDSQNTLADLTLYISFYISIQNSLAGTIGTVQSSTHNHKQTSPPRSSPPRFFSFCECIWRGVARRERGQIQTTFPPPFSFRTRSNFIIG